RIGRPWPRTTLPCASPGASRFSLAGRVLPRQPSDRRMDQRMTGVESVEIEIVRLPHGQDLDLPDYATAAAAGADLLAAIDREIELGPLERKIVPTGISIALPVGFEAQVRPRSGLAARHGITVANAPGT